MNVSTDIENANEFVRGTFENMTIPDLLPLFPDYGPKRHIVRTPHEPAYLIERDGYARRYSDILLEGIEMGFLVYNGCSECAGEAEIDTSEETMDLVFDETPEEHAERLRHEFPHGITFRTITGPTNEDV